MAIKRLSELTYEELKNLAHNNRYLKDAAYMELVYQTEDKIVYNVLPSLKPWLRDWEFGANTHCILTLKSDAYERPEEFCKALKECYALYNSTGRMASQITKLNNMDWDLDSDDIRVILDSTARSIGQLFALWFAECEDEEVQVYSIIDSLTDYPTNIFSIDNSLIFVNTEDNTIAWDEVVRHKYA